MPTMVFKRRAEILLEQWRAVKAALTQAEPGSPDAADLAYMEARLRAAYGRLDHEAKERGRPAPSSFPSGGEEAS